jgi:hypothetical protein
MTTREETRQKFEAEKSAYWAMRESLLKEHQGQWVAVVDGQVVAVGNKAGRVIEEAYRQTGSEVGFAVRVGYEDAVRRIRQVTSGGYEQGYDPPMPMVIATVTNLRGDLATEVDFLVDPGSDGTTLRDEVATGLNLWERPWGLARVSGVGGTPVEHQLYAAVVLMAGQPVTIQADCRDDIEEDLLGRDVINEFELTLCAKRDVVRFEWVPD